MPQGRFIGRCTKYAAAANEVQTGATHALYFVSNRMLSQVIPGVCRML